MKLRGLLEPGGRRRSFIADALDRPRKLEACASQLAAKFDAASQVPEQEELRHLLQRFRKHRLEIFTKREWARAIWGIWDAEYPLSKIDSFWATFAGFLRTTGRRTHYKNLILTYIRDFQQGRADFEEAGALIRAFLSSDGQAEWLWSRRQNRFRLFEPTKGPQSVAAFLLDEGQRLRDALEEVGCSGIVAGGGFEQAAFAYAIESWNARIKGGTPDAPRLARTLEWAERDKDLRFPTLRKELVEALLLPWRDTRPEPGIQALISGFVLRHLRDPRIDRRSWVGICEPAQQVMRRWLTKASLEQFIAVVTRVAKGSHWKYRKAFWMAYYDQDQIDEAWVLFGREARSRASDAFEEGGGYGEIVGGLSNHCVLLLRIGSLTIADWSHDGKCRIWRGGNEHAPQLYQRAPYQLAQLQRNANFEQTHHGSERHSWQESLATAIHDETGVWVPVSARRPRGG